jgi:tRNA(Ile)-lysidine synthase TilS/MesJ
MFDHGTGFHSTALPVVEAYCQQWNIKLHHGGPAAGLDTAGLSPEQAWRQQRYQWLDQFDATVVLAHHLDDVAETWVWSCLHGTPKLIPILRHSAGAAATYVRPFLETRRRGFTDWCTKHSVAYVDDRSNVSDQYVRGRIRNTVMPAALSVNPGLHAMLAKKIATKYQSLLTAS